MSLLTNLNFENVRFFTNNVSDNSASGGRNLLIQMSINGRGYRTLSDYVGVSLLQVLTVIKLKITRLKVTMRRRSSVFSNILSDGRSSQTMIFPQLVSMASTLMDITWKVATWKSADIITTKMKMSRN